MSREHLVPLRLGVFASDPAGGVAGDVYFSSTTLRARLYSNGAWGDLAGAADAANPNRIINGDIAIDQANAGASLALSTTELYSADCFKALKSTTGGGTIQQVAATGAALEAGFLKALKWTTTTGNAPAAADVNFILHSIEGQNISDFCFGFSNAKAVTLVFYAESSLTGTHSVCFTNGPRAYIATFTVNVANTSGLKVVTIPGDVAGTWSTTNAAGLSIVFDTGYGADAEGTAGSWQTAAIRRTSGSVKVVGTSGATLIITGLTLHAGSVALPFKFESIERRLAACRRQFRKSFQLATAPAQNVGPDAGEAVGMSGVAGANPIFIPVTFDSPMRAAPTVVTFNPGAADAQMRDDTIGANCTATAVNSISDRGFIVTATGHASTAVGDQLKIHWTADARL